VWFRATVQMFSQLPAAPKEHKPRFLPAATPLDNAIDSFVTRAASVAEGVGHESVTPDEDATPYLWNALAYTIAAYEQTVRPVQPLFCFLLRKSRKCLCHSCLFPFLSITARLTSPHLATR
jgi:hypothetical protein